MAKRKSTVSKFIVGAAVSAAVAAGVVGFLTQTKRGKALAKKGKQHASQLAKKVATRAEKMKVRTQKKYDELVDEVIAEYMKRSKLTKAAAEDLAKEIKKEWTHVREELRK